MSDPAATAAATVVPAVPAAPQTEAQRQEAALAVTAAHNAALDKLAAAPAVTPPVVAAPVVPTKPAGVPDKFWNAAKGEVDYAAWGNAHVSLETELHKSKAPAQAAAPAVTPPVPDPAAAAAAPAVDPRKSAIDAATTELSTNGKISDATYTSLEKAGYDRNMVDTYIAGRHAQVAPLEQAAFEPIGGTREAYTAMIQWAAQNMGETEIAAYDAQVASKNPAVIKAAATALAVKYRAAVPVEGTRVGGQPPAAPSGVFNSKSEMTAAMSDPRYAGDVNFRNDVIKKMQGSRAAGIDLFN